MKTTGLLCLLLIPCFLMGGTYERPAAPRHIVFVIGEQEYDTKETLPAFAERELIPRGFSCTFVHADPDDRNVFPGLEAVREADLLVLSVRRRALAPEALDLIRRHLDAGKPLVAVRTASHAFQLRRERLPRGHVEWRDFDTEVLGAHYERHHPNEYLPDIDVAPGAGDDPLLAGISSLPFRAGGSLYRYTDLAPDVHVLLEGRLEMDGRPYTEPVAWTRKRGGQRIFYTSLGHPDDFERAAFRRLLTNAVYWSLDEALPPDTTLGDFFEPDFPFITTTVDASKLGDAYPERNVAVRALVIRLGNGAYAAFDTDLLRMAAGWTGEALELNTMAAVSYHQEHNKRNGIPTLKGEPVFATGLYPGWLGAAPAFEDPRPAGENPAEPGRGPIDARLGRWNGLYLAGDRVVLSYTVRGTEVSEVSASVRRGDDIALTRTIQTGPVREALTLVVAEVGDGHTATVSDETAKIWQGDRDKAVTSVGLVGAPEGVALDVTDARYVTVRLPQGTPASRFRVVVWKGPEGRAAVFEEMLEEGVAMPDFAGGSPARWLGTAVVQGQASPDTAALVLDRLGAPVPNAWRRNVRPAGLAFFDDGRAVVSTFDGDVWIVSGIDAGLGGVAWKRYASGLYEPMSVQVVDGAVYTFGRGQITRFHDLNGDGEADYYENFSNLVVQTLESREFPLDMVKRPGGGFYLSKGGALDAGPSTSPSVMSGFRAGGPYSGSVVEVSADGRSARLFASGFREPYLGIHPETGLLTASDQQGNFVPSTPIYVVRDGGFYGVPATAHRKDPPPEEAPLTWIPHHVDRSGSSQVWAISDRMGPLSGALLHLSYGQPAAFRVFMDEDAGQGGIFRLPVPFTGPVQKGAVNPVDGLVYLVGFQVWDSSAPEISTFARLRYTGGTAALPVELRAGAQGILLRFEEPLEAETSVDPRRFEVQRWNYRRTNRYGSGHFKLNGSTGRETMRVGRVLLSADRRAVFLPLRGMVPVMQMSVDYRLVAEGTPGELQGSVYLTLNHVQPIDLAGAGFEAAAGEEPAVVELPDTARIDVVASAERGEALYRQFGCNGCHSADGTTEGKTGPTFKGLYGATRRLDDGTSVTADEAYIRTALLDPGAQVVEGYSVAMASYQGILDETDLASIVLFVKSLE